MHGQNWNYYMNDLRQYIEQQDKRIKALEEQIQNLITNQQENGNIIIEKIEYKFDQLKVETLSGSLHIGLSPEDIKNMEDIALGHIEHSNSTQPLPHFDKQLTTELNEWLQQSGPGMIQDLAKNYNRSIDQAHEKLLIQDIQKQFPNRIVYYENQALQNNNSLNENELKDYILNHIKGEVQHSLANYIKNNKGDLNHDHGSS